MYCWQKLSKELIMGIASEYVLNKQTAGHTKRKAKHARVCQNIDCGKSFTSYDPRAKYCSRNCTLIAWRKQKPPLITDAQVRKEDGLDRLKTPHVCDTSRFGYCVPCRLREMRKGRDKVLLTDEATRTRTRENYHKATAAMTANTSGD
jgi:hypothetical protein